MSSLQLWDVMQPKIICSWRFTTGVSDWIVTWGSSHEFKFLHIPYRSKIEQSATRQRNGIKNSEMEICMRN